MRFSLGRQLSGLMKSIELMITAAVRIWYVFCVESKIIRVPSLESIWRETYMVLAILYRSRHSLIAQLFAVDGEPTNADSLLSCMDSEQNNMITIGGHF